MTSWPLVADLPRPAISSWRTKVERPPADAIELGFTAVEKGGPLVAICALCGGAGASTLAYLIAVSAAQHQRALRNSAAVIVCDATARTDGLALYAGIESRHSLAEMADGLAAGSLTASDMFATDGNGLRIVGTRPRPSPEPEREALIRLLCDAREAHGLTVVDCGPAGDSTGRITLELATHIVWIAPATEGGTRRAERTLATIPLTGAHETLVARSDSTAPRAPMRALARIADSRRGPLILMPPVPDLASGSSAAAIDACQVTLQALAAWFRR